MPVRAGSARRYADALFAIAGERRTVDAWADELNRIASVAREPLATRLLGSPALGAKRKRQVIESLAGPLSKETLALVEILLERKRGELVPALAEAFAERMRQQRGIELAEVTTATELNEEDRQLVARWLGGYLGRTVELQNHVDPEIIGGVVARVGDRLIDGSVRGRLEALRRQLGTA